MSIIILNSLRCINLMVEIKDFVKKDLTNLFDTSSTGRTTTSRINSLARLFFMEICAVLNVCALFEIKNNCGVIISELAFRAIPLFFDFKKLFSFRGRAALNNISLFHLSSIARRGADFIFPEQLNLITGALNLEFIWRMIFNKEYSIPVQKPANPYDLYLRDSIPELLAIDSVLNEHRCPITREIIKTLAEDPLTGHFYERNALRNWFEIRGNYPLTRRSVLEGTDAKRTTEDPVLWFMSLFSPSDPEKYLDFLHLSVRIQAHLFFWSYISKKMESLIPSDREFNEEESHLFYQKMKAFMDRETPDVFNKKIDDGIIDDIINFDFCESVKHKIMQFICPLTKKPIIHAVKFKNDEIFYEKEALLRSIRDNEFPDKTEEDVIECPLDDVYEKAFYCVKKDYKDTWETMQKVFAEHPELLVAIMVPEI